MIEQTFSIPSSFVDSGGQNRIWYYNSVVPDELGWYINPGRPRISEPGLLPSGGNIFRYLAKAVFHSNGQFELSIGDASSGGDTVGADLHSDFETNGKIDFVTDVGSLSMRLRGEDLSDPYIWTPSNSDEVIAYYNALLAGDPGQLSTLTLGIRSGPENISRNTGRIVAASRNGVDLVSASRNGVDLF